MNQDDTDRMFDRRVVRRNIATGRITSADHDRFVSALQDAGENIKPEDEGGDNDGYEAMPEVEEAPVAELPGDPAAGFGSPAPMEAAAPAAGLGNPAPAAPALGTAPVAPVVGTAPVAPVASPAPAAPMAPAPAPAAEPAPTPTLTPVPDPGTEPPTGA